MATKKKTSQKTKQDSLLRKHWKKAILVLVLLLPFAVYAGYNLREDYLDQKDQERFATAAESVKELKKRFEVSDSSIEWKYEEDCIGTRRVKFDILPPVCSVSVETLPLVDVASVEDVERQIDRHDDIIFKSSTSLFAIKEGTAAKPMNLSKGIIPAEDNKYDYGYTKRTLEVRQSGMKCSMTYTIKQNLRLRIGLTCGDDARKEWY
jgi:hypothetical protein